MQLQQRLKILQSSLEDHQGLVLARPADIQYLTGFKTITSNEREAFLVVTKKSVTLLYPSFSPVEKIVGIEYFAGHWPSDLKKVITDASNHVSDSQEHKQQVTDWQADLSALFADEYQLISNIKHTKWQTFSRDKIWQLRQIKDHQELELFRAANQITLQAVKLLQAKLKIGMSEIEVAREFEYSAKKLGATELAFPPVIAFGAHSALPHHQPTKTVLEPEQVVLIDVGARVDGYCADLTRTIWFGNNPDQQFLEIKNIVDTAYELAADQVKPEVFAADVDGAARKFIDDAGYGHQFIHSTGHGLGLEIHEPPSLFMNSTQKLRKNMLVTVEPGIYLDGRFGYRYENTITVST